MIADERHKIVKAQTCLRARRLCGIMNVRPILARTCRSLRNMTHLSISLLGSFQTVLDGRPVTNFGTDKARALLAYLAVEADRPHRRDALTGLLWARQPQALARQSLRQALYQVRQALDDQDRAVPYLLIDRETVRLNPDSDHWLDVAELTVLGEANRRHRHRELDGCLPCQRRMERMAALYKGELLAGFFLDDSYAFDEWVTLQREHLHRQAMEALDCLAAYYERRGHLARAIEAAQRLLQLEPWREEAHRHLMRLYWSAGQRSAGLAQYQACARILAEEMGLAPTAETTALYEQICDAGGRRPERTSPAAFCPPPELPRPPTLFVGRAKALADVAELLADPDCRLVTLLGPGGIGKTRLALQAASDQVGLWAHGVAFVALDTLSTADLLAPTVAEALRFRFHSQGDPEQQILDFLREKELLLVLDNMEHVLEGCDFVARILRHAPGVTLLVTSRERLSLREEWVYELEGLRVPECPQDDDLETFSAVALFVLTARRARRQFLLSEETAADVVRICQLVEGLPLAVELAAAWMATHSGEEVIREIERNLDLLSTSMRNMPERHRSLRAAFEHSWDLLSERERAAFARMCLFQGGCEANAARQVTGAPAGLLAGLVDKSLVRRNAGGRYELHRLVRQYGAEKLDEMPQHRNEAERLLCEYYARFVHDRAGELRGGKQVEALAAIAAEIENVRLAWQLALGSGNVEAMGRSLAGLGTFYAIRSWHQEGAQAFGRAADGLVGRQAELEANAPAAEAAVLEACLAWQGYFVHQLGEIDRAQELVERSLEALPRHGARREKAFSLLALAQILCFGRNEYAEAERLYRESLDLYQGLGDLYGSAQALDGLGDIAARQGKHDEAQACYEEGLALRREIGDLWGLSASLGSLGGLAGRRGAYDEAQRWFEESLQIGRALDNLRGVAASLHNLSTLAYLRQEYGTAKRLRRETLEICRQIGYRWGIASSLKSLGDVAYRLGEYGEARRFLSESLVILEESGDRRSQAFTLNSLGMVAAASGNRRESQRHLQQALEMAVEIQEPALAVDVLGSLARSAAEAGEVTEALALMAFVVHHPACEEQTRTQLLPLQQELEAQLSPDEAAAAAARGQALSLEGIVAGIRDAR